MLRFLYNYSFCLQLNILYLLRSQQQPKMEAKQTQVVQVNTLSYSGKSDYSKWATKGNFQPTEPKCNLFVGDCLLAAGVDLQLDLIDAPGKYKLFTLWCGQKKLKRPPTAAMWANPNYDNQRFKVVGYGVDGLQKCWPGDVISNGSHCGIISGVRKVISASYTENKVVQNDWGWRKGECHDVVIRRYHP